MTLHALGQDMHLMTGDMVTPILFGVCDLGELEDWYWGARGEAMTEALLESVAYTVRGWRRLYLNEPVYVGIDLACPDQEGDRSPRYRECHPTPPQECGCPWAGHYAGCQHG